MDLAGLAALLGVPAVLIAAVAAPLRDRGLWARLDRIEKHLASGTSSPQMRKMLESARDHLIERIAMRELRPRWSGLWELAGWLTGVAVTAFVALLVGDFKGSERVVLFVVCLGTWAAALILVNVIRMKREKWLSQHRDTAYDRSSDPMT